MTLNAETWRLYADLCRFEAPSHKPDMEKVEHFLFVNLVVYVALSLTKYCLLLGVV